MSSNLTRAAALGALGLCLLAPVAHAAIVQNGSFELPSIPDNAALSVTPTGWNWSGTAGFVINPGVGSLPAQAGEQFADIGNTSASALTQSFQIDTAGSYRLTWFDNADAFAAVAPYRVSFSGGNASQDFDANEGIDGQWNARSLLLEFTTGLHTLTFAPRDTAGPLPAQDRFIDDVALAAVPLPAAAWLFGSAASVLCGFRRRR